MVDPNTVVLKAKSGSLTQRLKTSTIASALNETARNAEQKTSRNISDSLSTNSHVSF